MRNRIMMTTINGCQHRVFYCCGPMGQRVSAVFVTSETPEHARSSIRKMCSYKYKVLHQEQKIQTAKDRRKAFFRMDRTQYRAAIGL